MIKQIEIAINVVSSKLALREYLEEARIEILNLYSVEDVRQMFQSNPIKISGFGLPLLDEGILDVLTDFRVKFDVSIGNYDTEFLSTYPYLILSEFSRDEHLKYFDCFNSVEMTEDYFVTACLARSIDAVASKASNLSELITKELLLKFKLKNLAESKIYGGSPESKEIDYITSYLEKSALNTLRIGKTAPKSKI